MQKISFLTFLNLSRICLKKQKKTPLLFLLSSLLCLANFTNGTYLTGWDNLQIELSFAINLERAFNAVWQEYQGLGLLGGMAHGADLLRQLFLWPFSLFLKYGNRRAVTPLNPKEKI